MQAIRVRDFCRTGIFTFLISISALSSTAIQAAIVEQDDWMCAADVKNVNDCTANEINIAAVTAAEVEKDGLPVSECNQGDIVTVTLLTLELNMNTGERYDLNVWIGKDNNDPRVANYPTQTCFASSLPGDGNGDPFGVFGHYEGASDDLCLDVNNPGGLNAEQSFTTPFDIECADADGDGFADIQTVITWHQNKNFDCGLEVPPLSPGATSKCDYSIESLGIPMIIPAIMTVVKNTNGADGTFNIDYTGGSDPTADTLILNSADGGNTDTESFETTDYGMYSLTEAAVAGWVLSDITCIDDHTSLSVGTVDLVTRTVSDINLQSDDDVTCTFTNSKLGTVNVVKNTVGAEGSFDFTTDVPGLGTMGMFNLTTSGMTKSTGTPVDGSVPAGTYFITEADPSPDFSLTSANCLPGDRDPASLTMEHGETVTCTFTNTAVGNIVVDKNTLPDTSGQLFTFTPSWDGGTTFDLAHATTPHDSGPLVAGIYSISEALPPGWVQTSISCTGNAEEVEDPTAINLEPGETVTCVFTNTQDGSIEVIKSLSATGPVSELFGFTSNFNSTFTLEGHNATTGAIPVTPGNGHTVTEDDPTAAGWANVGASCTGGGEDPRSEPIDVAPGEAVVCTFTNTPLGSATIIKNTVGGNGTFDFIGDAPFNGLQLTTENETKSQDFTFELNAGQYDITESPIPEGWALTDLGCMEDGDQDSSVLDATATLDVELAETVTCTFENTADGVLVIEKQTIPDGAEGTFEFTGDVSGSIGDGGQLSDSFQPGNFGSTEEDLAGFELTDISCTGATDSVVVIGAEGGYQTGDKSVDVALAAGETVTCVFTNTALGSISIVKDTVGGDGTFTFNRDFGDSFPLTSDGVDSITFGDLLPNPGGYMISEVIPTNWTLGLIECLGPENAVSTVTIGGAGGFEPGDEGVTIALLDGEDWVCTFTNNSWATIEVAKETLPDQSSQAFDFTGEFTPQLTDGTSASTRRPAGQYSVVEDLLSGWDLTAIDCGEGNNSSGDVPSRTASYDVTWGEVVTCEFTNTQRATITLVKNVVTDDGGTATDANFSAFLDGGAKAWGVATEVLPNIQYTASETAQVTGYDSGNGWFNACAPDGTVTPTPGQNLTCEITNDDIAPTLTLVKTVTTDNGGTAVATQWNLAAAGPTPINGDGGVGPSDVNVGDYTLSESTGPSGYEAGDWSCTGTGDQDGSSINLTEGETATCTINNDDVSPTLQLIKTVTTDNGGTAVASDWNLAADGPTPIDGDGGVGPSDVDVGSYDLSESGGPDGYEAGDWSCEGDGDQDGSSVTLTEGQSATCTINNDDISPTLELVKTVTTDNGGTAVATDWNLAAAGPTPIDGDGGVGPSDVDVGSYDLSESGGPDGYEAGDWSCEGDGEQDGSSVTLTEGQSATCTINNDDISPTLELVKTVTTDNGGTAVATDWNLAADGPTPIDGDGGVGPSDVDVGSYDLSESGGPDGYEAGDWSCEGDGEQDGSSVTLTEGQSATCTINNDDISPTLELVKTVTTDNGGTAVATDWNLAAAGPTPIDGDGGVGPSDVDVGSYDLSEAGGPDGYEAGAWSCEGDGDQDGSSVTLTEGQSATCTINNDDIPPRITVVKEVIGLPDLRFCFAVTGPQLSDEFCITTDGGIGQDEGPDDLLAGLYSIIEQIGGPYAVLSSLCDNGDTAAALTVEVGDDVTCRFVNIPVTPVPVNNPLALIMLILTMLATGWYFRPAAMRRI